jgi:hypothetical protein
VGADMGYTVTLEWVVDKRNMKLEQHAGLAQSLDEVVIVLYRWLVERQNCMQSDMNSNG